MQKLTVGRIVHYSRDGRWVAAICVEEPGEDYRAELFVFPTAGRDGEVVAVDVRDQDDGEGGANVDSWRWPPRV
ncbi:MAG TPA: hypothetical protein VMZ50_08285 [Phycisphaerae bacterium]|nr:hypothetical protein [Phycisphaerae bacterium]